MRELAVYIFFLVFALITGFLYCKICRVIRLSVASNYLVDYNLLWSMASIER